MTGTVGFDQIDTPFPCFDFTIQIDITVLFVWLILQYAALHNKK
jgi:hypothetical protein